MHVRWHVIGMITLIYEGISITAVVIVQGFISKFRKPNKKKGGTVEVQVPVQ